MSGQAAGALKEKLSRNLAAYFYHEAVYPALISKKSRAALSYSGFL